MCSKTFICWHSETCILTWISIKTVKRKSMPQMTGWCLSDAKAVTVLHGWVTSSLQTQHLPEDASQVSYCSQEWRHTECVVFKGQYLTRNMSKIPNFWYRKKKQWINYPFQYSFLLKLFKGLLGIKIFSPSKILYYFFLNTMRWAISR